MTKKALAERLLEFLNGADRCAYENTVEFCEGFKHESPVDYIVRNMSDPIYVRSLISDIEGWEDMYPEETRDLLKDLKSIA